MLWELISYFLINFSIFFFFYLATLALRISLPLLRKCQEEATSTGCTPATARWVSAALSSTCRQFVLINQQREVPRSHLLGSEPVCGKVGSWLALFLRNTSGRAKVIEIGLTFFFFFPSADVSTFQRWTSTRPTSCPKKRSSLKQEVAESLK